GLGCWLADPQLAIAPRKDAMPEAKRSNVSSSPGLFGSYPWVDNDRNYAAFLFVYNLRHKGRQERYRELKEVVDAAVR
ncbi:MAG TPA: hypothetical protein PKE63_14345, partial [Lacibacter sp.]|nr:hypothetical protein [Lacibacter sp.]